MLLYMAMAQIMYNGCREAVIYREVGLFVPIQS